MGESFRNGLCLRRHPIEHAFLGSCGRGWQTFRPLWLRGVCLMGPVALAGKKDADNGDYPEGYGGGIKDIHPERVDSEAPPGPTEMERLRIELAERERQ